MTKFLKNKMRLDQYLVENEYFEDLEKAKNNAEIAQNNAINEKNKETEIETSLKNIEMTLKRKQKKFSKPKISTGLPKNFLLR